MHRRKHLLLLAACIATTGPGLLRAPAAAADDECCDEVGQAHECWYADAQVDGVTCSTTNMSNCAGGMGCQDGLCECDPASEVNQCNEGVCTAAGVCGPSWCNGYLVCSCWGGCIEANEGVEPLATCAALELGCCEGTYPAQPETDDAPAGEGFCSDDPTCGLGCDEDGDCDDDNPCTSDNCVYGGCVNTHLDDTAPLTAGCALGADESPDCAQPWCEEGDCAVDAINDGAECDENVLPPAAPLSWDPQCWYNGCEEGRCVVQARPVGFACDDGNPCSSASACDESHACAPTAPASPAVGECCDPGIPGTYEDAEPCTHNWCDALFHDQVMDLPVGADCQDAAHVNDSCGVWSCDGAGSCVEETELYEKNACYSDSTFPVIPAGPGPGGTQTLCRTWECSDEPGEEGDCVAVDRNEGDTCAWPGAPDSCGRQVCVSGDCVYLQGDGEACTPAPDSCCDYACAGHACAETCTPASPELEVCDGDVVGALAATNGSSFSANRNNRCASDDYDVDAAGIFADGCGVADEGELVHRFVERTVDSATPASWQLRHTLVTLDAHSSWDPLLYSSTSCAAPAAPSGPQPDQYTCNDDCDFAGTNLGTAACGSLGADDAALTTGPWPIQDWPDSSQTDDVDTRVEYVTALFADARNTSAPSGGPYTVGGTVEAHNNNSCVDTAEYRASPRIEGQSGWKNRWQGTTSGYSNFFAESGASLAGYCWSGGAPTATDPKPAFFRVDLPGGAEALSQGTTAWGHSYKVYTDHSGRGLAMATVLDWWGANPAEGSCVPSLSSSQGCANGSHGAYPRELVVRSADALRSGWISVTNDAAGQSGPYEVNVVRAPRPFLGPSQVFAGNGSGMGCCSGVTMPSGSYSSFNLAGKRLDFTPTNDDIRGFTVRKGTAAVGASGWLVDPSSHAVICTGAACAAPAVTAPYDVGFSFPFAGDFWPKFCVDTAGRLQLTRSSTGCVNKWDKGPDTAELTETYAPAVAPMWGTLIPCRNVRYPSCVSSGFLRKDWSSPRDVECIYDTTVPGGDGCSFLFGNTCGLWKWNETTCENPATLTYGFTSFEGASALVVTWDNFDGYLNPNDGGSNGSLQFQAILRADGRVTFFYRTPTADPTAYADALLFNGWVVGMSGGRSATCTDDAYCNSAAAFGAATSGLICDETSVTVSGISSDPLWEAKNKCLYPVNFQAADGVLVSGTWQGD